MKDVTTVRRGFLLFPLLAGIGILLGCSLFLNSPPVADVSAGPLEGGAPLAVTFDGGGSYDTDGTVSSYRWSFGDGMAASGTAVTHTYADAGTYTATLTVTDDGGEQDAATCEVVAREATNYAIIVGIAAYRDLSQLTYTDDDAWSVWSRLRTLDGWSSENMVLLLNSDATSANLVAALDDLDGASSDDLLFVFFSGHGTKTLDDDLIEEADGLDECLCLYDQTYFRDDTLATLLAQVPMDRIVVMIDSCYSGGQLNSLGARADDASSDASSDSWAEGFLDDLERVAASPTLDLDALSKSIVAVSASRYDEYSWELTALEHGAFTYALLEAFNGSADSQGNDDGYLSAEECYDYVAVRIPVLLWGTGAVETPQLLDLCPSVLNFAGVP